jgi:predicted ATPase
MGRRYMKIGKHTKFMINFISDFINGETERYFFNLDYNAYVIEHFPYMEIEDSRLANRFANTIDRAYEHGTSLRLSDEEFRIEISKAFEKWLGSKKADIS